VDEKNGALYEGPPRCFRIDGKAADKMLVHAVPALWGRIDWTFSRKLEGLTDWLDQILIDDCSAHAKQQHTVVRTFERLRDERGFTSRERMFASI
jgi:hypothetical protein